MNVLVAGGTGFIGTALCRELDDRGHEVTALSRDPSDADLPDGVETASGDVREYDSFEADLEGQDAVVNLVALSPVFQAQGATQEGVHLDGTRNLVRAAEEHGVSRFLQMSANGADPSSDIAHIRAKGRAEAVVRDAPLEWVIFRPSIIFGDGDEFADFTRLVTTPYVTGLPGGQTMRFQPIWVEDLVPMLAEAVEDDRHVGQTYEIGGPEVLTLAEVTKLVYRAEGKSVRIVPIPIPLAKLGLAIVDPIPFVPLGRNQGRSLELDNIVADNDVESFGVEPDDLTTYGAYLGVE